MTLNELANQGAKLKGAKFNKAATELEEANLMWYEPDQQKRPNLLLSLIEIQ